MGNSEAIQLQNLQNKNVISNSDGFNNEENSGGYTNDNRPEIEMSDTQKENPQWSNPNVGSGSYKMGNTQQNKNPNMGNMPDVNPQWGNPNMGPNANPQWGYPNMGGSYNMGNTQQNKNPNMGNTPNANPQWGNPNMGPNANPQWGYPNMGGSYNMGNTQQNKNPNMGNTPNANPQWRNPNMGPNANPQWGYPNMGGSYNMGNTQQNKNPNMGNTPNANPQWGNPNMGPNANPQWGYPNMGGSYNMGNTANTNPQWGNMGSGFYNMGMQYENPNMDSNSNTSNIGFVPTRRKSNNSSSNKMGENPSNGEHAQEVDQRIPDSEIKAQLFGVSFEVFGDFTSNQGYVNKKYIQSTGRFMTLTGWLEDTEQGSVRGYCEGHRVYIDAVKYLISEDDHSVAYIDKTVFGELKPIKEREFDKFMFRHDIMTPEIREFFTPRRPEYRLTRRPYVLAGQVPPWMTNSYYDQMIRSKPRTLGFVDN